MGGVFLTTVCDYVVGCEEVVLNPYYKILALSGSEYHTYSLPKSIKTAHNIGLVDIVFGFDNYQKDLETYCSNLLSDEDIYDEFIMQKQNYIDDNKALINSCKEKEIKTKRQVCFIN